MAINVNDVLRITAVLTAFDTDEWNNVFNFQCTVNTTADDDAAMDIIATYIDSLYDFIDLQMSDLIDYTSILGINLTQDVLLPAKLFPSLVSGGSAAHILPVQTAACVFFRTLTPKIRASKFFGGFTEDSNEVDGSLAAGTITNLASLGASLVTGIDTATFDALYGAYNGVLARFTPVVSPAVPTRWRTQRRRRLGVGS